MAGRLAWALMVAILLAAAGQARAQDREPDDALLLRFYASVKERTHTEYEFIMAGITRQVLGSGAPISRIAPRSEERRVGKECRL